MSRFWEKQTEGESKGGGGHEIIFDFMENGLRVEPYPLWMREQHTSNTVQGEAGDNGTLASWRAHGGHLWCAPGWETLKPHEQGELHTPRITPKGAARSPFSWPQLAHPMSGSVLPTRWPQGRPCPFALWSINKKAS